MIVTSVVVLAIVGSAFAFNAKKLTKFCVTTSSGVGNCYTIDPSKRTTVVPGSVVLQYATDWDGSECTTNTACNTLARFVHD